MRVTNKELLYSVQAGATFQAANSKYGCKVWEYCLCLGVVALAAQSNSDLDVVEASLNTSDIKSVDIVLVEQGSPSQGCCGGGVIK